MLFPRRENIKLDHSNVVSSVDLKSRHGEHHSTHTRFKVKLVVSHRRKNEILTLRFGNCSHCRLDKCSILQEVGVVERGSDSEERSNSVKLFEVSARQRLKLHKNEKSC